jgi:ankyrin repeat protein
MLLHAHPELYNIVTCRSMTPLHIAVMNNSVHTIKQFLGMHIQLIGDINAKNQWGETALHLAAALGQTGIASSLLHQGAMLTVTDIWGRTPQKV